MKSAWDWKWKSTEQFDHFCALCEGNLSDWCTFQNHLELSTYKKKNWSIYKLKERSK